MAPTFVSVRLAELRDPMNGPQAQALARALGSAQDDEMARLRVAALARLPLYCPDDALDGVGRWLNIERFPSETDDAYRDRIKEAWATWKIAGSADAIVKSLQAYGITDVQVVSDYDFGSTHDYSMFVVILGPDFGTLAFEEQTWGTFSWGDDSTWGSTATEEQRDQIIGQILKWKSAHSVPVFVCLDFGGGFIWGVSEWGDASTWGDPDPCLWYLANIWGESMVWGESVWGTGRWYAPNNGF